MLTVEEMWWYLWGYHSRIVYGAHLPNWNILDNSKPSSRHFDFVPNWIVKLMLQPKIYNQILLFCSVPSLVLRYLRRSYIAVEDVNATHKPQQLQ